MQRKYTSKEYNESESTERREIEILEATRSRHDRFPELIDNLALIIREKSGLMRILELSRQNHKNPKGTNIPELVSKICGKEYSESPNITARLKVKEVTGLYQENRMVGIEI